MIAKEDVQMIKDEAPEPASQTEEMPSQKRAVLEESPSDSTDHLEEKEMGRTQAKETANSWPSTAVTVQELLSKEERKKLIETKILSKIPVEPSPKQDVKPPSHGINNSLGRFAKAETPSAEPLGEVIRLSLQASGPEMKLWGCCRWAGAQCRACKPHCRQQLRSQLDTPQSWVIHRYQNCPTAVSASPDHAKAAADNQLIANI